MGYFCSCCHMHNSGYYTKIMNKYTFFKDLGLLIGGLFVGYSVGHYVTKVKYENIIATELKHIEEYFEGKHPEKYARGENSENGSTAGVVGSMERHSIDEEYVKPKPVNYTTFYNEADLNNEDFLAECESPSEEDAPEASNTENIVVISPNEFGEAPMFEQYSLLYYTGNDILTIKDHDGEDMLYIDDIEDHLGGVLDTSGFKTDNRTHLYVRNYRSGCDYAIEKVPRSFGED